MQIRPGWVTTASIAVALATAAAISVSAAGAADSGHPRSSARGQDARTTTGATHARARTDTEARSAASAKRVAVSAAPKSSTAATSTAAMSTAAEPTAAKSTGAKQATAKQAAATTATAAPFLASLATHANTAAQESKAGFKVGMLEVQWSRFEPERGKVDRSYAAGIRAQFNKLRNAGMQVTLSPGLHFTPAWLLATKSNRMVNEHGQYSKQADFVFNRAVRRRANFYLHELDHWIDFKRMWAIRVTSGGSSELLYPAGGFWAYSPGAQSSKNRPKNVRANPDPGYRPGDKSTLAQRSAWAHWYVGALASDADWQMSTAKSLGFQGYFQIVTPGQGVRPQQWNQLVATGLDSSTLARGAAWYALYGSLRERANVVAYLSSLADGSSGDDSCASGDTKLPYKGTNFFRWSSARWLSWVAHHFGYKIAGEPSGYPTGSAARAHYVDRSTHGLLATAMRQAKSCGFQGVFWAHDDQIWDNTMPLKAFAAYTSTSAREPAVAPAMR